MEALHKRNWMRKSEVPWSAWHAYIQNMWSSHLLQLIIYWHFIWTAHIKLNHRRSSTFCIGQAYCLWNYVDLRGGGGVIERVKAQITLNQKCLLLIDKKNLP